VQALAPQDKRGVDVRHGDADVIYAAEHGRAVYRRPVGGPGQG